jgi:hypothetical protein
MEKVIIGQTSELLVMSRYQQRTHNRLLGAVAFLRSCHSENPEDQLSFEMLHEQTEEIPR